MKQLQSVLFFRRKSNSLFIRLLAGFLCIILLLASLTMYSLSVSKRSVRQEIVKYNTLMLENTMNGYEKHLDLVKRQLYLFFFSEEVQRFQNNPNYTSFPLIIREISTLVANPYLFIDNIVLYSKRDEQVLEKGTSTNAVSMFDVFYRSAEYPLDFWRQQFAEPYTFQVLPSSVISTSVFRDRPQQLGEFIPIVFKNEGNRDFYMVVFLDAVKLYKASHQSVYDDFVLYDNKGQTLFRSGEQDSLITYADLQKYGETEFIRDEKYHFIKIAQATGYRYLYRVPVERIAYQTRLNITLIVIMAAAITLSVMIAFLFAVRINNPLKKVIESIRSMNEGSPYRSSINEFNIISDEIHGNRMLRRQVGFINRLKAIRNQEADAANLDFADKPFVFVLHHIQPHALDATMQAAVQKWMYYLKTYIDSKLKPAFPDSQTFQIERDQILSLVFTDRSDDLAELVGQMKEVFDHDKEYGAMTIAMTPVHSSADELTAAYEEAQLLVGDRRLMSETQMIRERAAMSATVFGFSPDQDKEFEVHLREGNGPQLTALLVRLFARWNGKPLTAAAQLRFAESVIGKIRNTATSFSLEPGRLESIVERAEERLERCGTTQELEQLLLECVTRTAAAVKERKEEKQPITAFVIEYINEHLSEEIYMDVLADKLKMSSGYLSSYFKAKTGKNIVDYINETRIAKATSLLSDNKIKIHDAAKAVGYQNITSFNRMFKKYTGVTPSEYRKRVE
ncbi:helix-turn-helix domain-containing protein [Paenibacillus koleovorans]|uniref:helix-turn-helix domain-containing protein n=1 Tax=Paenibacillus koleovorans TaxID=121608 RepID=UPI000FDBC556|nr:AraC family transcriptional regulator [Paenibacillus koleovorans]